MGFDFDFARYVERRKGAQAAEVREGAAYAYGGDLRILRTLDRVKPVRMALDQAVRLWRTSARAELLGPAMRASANNQPRVFSTLERAASALHVSPPPIYVSPAPLAPQSHDGGPWAFTFGSDEEPALVVHASLAEQLTDGELLQVVGAELGHVQNRHVTYRTALYFLTHSAGSFLRWIVRPATAALAAWHRRALVTADRAGLLCARDLDVSRAGLVHSALGIEAHATSPDALSAHPELARRCDALALFAESAYFRGVLGESGGLEQSECDHRVAEVLS